MHHHHVDNTTTTAGNTTEDHPVEAGAGAGAGAAVQLHPETHIDRPSDEAILQYERTLKHEMTHEQKLVSTQTMSLDALQVEFEGGDELWQSKSMMRIYNCLSSPINYSAYYSFYIY